MIKKGFCIIEILTVILIIGILFSLGLGTYQNSMNKVQELKEAKDKRDEYLLNLGNEQNVFQGFEIEQRNP